MAKAKKTAAKRGSRLTGSQITRLRKLFEKAILDAAFRRRLLSDPRKVLGQFGIGLSPAQTRQVEKIRKALLKKARQIEQAAVEAARKLSDKASVVWPTIR